MGKFVPGGVFTDPCHPFGSLLVLSGGTYGMVVVVVVVVWIHLSPLVVLMVPSDILCFIRFSGVASRWVCLSHLGCSVCPIWVAVSVPSGLLCLSHLLCVTLPLTLSTMVFEYLNCKMMFYI